jgi:hypothetical protein
MLNNDIKKQLREAIEELFHLDEKVKKRKKKKREKDYLEKDKSERKGRKEYADVKRAFQKLGGPSMVDIMKLCGIPDDDKGVNRSLFRKKVKQIKNPDTGSIYQFNDQELADVRAAIEKN